MQRFYFETYAPEIYEMFFYKHAETIEYVKSSLHLKKNGNFLGLITDKFAIIHRVFIYFRFKNAKFSGYFFYMNPNI